MWAVLDLEADPCVLSPYAVHKGGYVYVIGVDTGTIYNILKRKTHL